MDWKLLIAVFALIASICNRPIARAWDYVFDNKQHVSKKIYKWVDFVLSYLFPLIGIILFWFMPMTKQSIFVMAASFTAINFNIQYSQFKTHRTIFFSVLSFLRERFGYKHDSEKYPF